MPTLTDLNLPPGAVVLHMSDGSTVVWESGEPNADLLYVIDKKNNVYSDFDGHNRPGHVDFDDGRSGNFTYEPNGNAVLHMSDGSRITTDANDHLLEVVDKEGNTYTKFDSQDRPEHIEFVDGRTGEFDYLANGHVTLTINDGPFNDRSVIEWDGDGDDAKLVSITDGDGNVYTKFDDQDRPGHVEFKDGNFGNFEYQPNGHVTLSLSDGTVIEWDSDGANAHLLSITGPDGTIYSQFDGDNHPHHVEFQDGTSGDFDYVN